MMSDLTPTPMSGGEFLFYQSEDGRIRLQVRLEGESVWLTQAQMSELFQRERSVITKHIRNVFEEGELVEQAVSANFAHTAGDGNPRTIDNYLENYGPEFELSGYGVLRGNRLKPMQLAIQDMLGHEADFVTISKAPKIGIFDLRAFLQHWRLILQWTQIAIDVSALADEGMYIKPAAPLRALLACEIRRVFFCSNTTSVQEGWLG